MALFEFRDLGGTTLVEFTRGPSYPLGTDVRVNVDASESPGGFIRAQIRGRKRRTWRLKFTWQPAATVAQLLTFVGRYAGLAEPFLFVCPEGTFRVRLLGPAQQWADVNYAHSEWECDLVEDLV